MNHWFNTTLQEAVDEAKKKKVSSEDEPAVLILADSWSGHSSAKQKEALRQIGPEVSPFPPLTTYKLRPLDVNYIRQYKKIYNCVAEKAFHEDIIGNITSREEIINLQSLIHDQFSSPRHRDMLLFA